MDIERIISERIIAILPAYLPMKGNCTTVITLQGGTYELDRTVKAVLKQLSRYFLVDLNHIKAYYGNLLNIKNLTPIPFNKDHVFIPIKVRRPISRNDGSIGYINIDHIEKVSKAEERVKILLTNSCTIDSLNSVETVNKHIKNGNIVKRLIDEKNQPYIYDQYDRPATKGDVVMIINELLRIRETIK